MPLFACTRTLRFIAASAASIASCSSYRRSCARAPATSHAHMNRFLFMDMAGEDPHPGHLVLVARREIGMQKIEFVVILENDDAEIVAEIRAGMNANPFLAVRLAHRDRR